MNLNDLNCPKAAARQASAKQLQAEAPFTANGVAKPTPPPAGFHRRQLPAPAIALSSEAGKTITKRAMAAGGMECFFRVIEALRTQDDPAFCGLGTLVTALNALEIDPGALWKGSWRWYVESMLNCCVSLDEIAESGLTFDEWTCLARCQGITVEACRTSDSSLEHFSKTVAAACASDRSVLCVSYSRRELGQSGGGHFSPIGGYDAASEMVLILDVARFKYPPHWVPLRDLWDAMRALDKSTGLPRGYALLSRYEPAEGAKALVYLTFGRERLQSVRTYFASKVAPIACAGESVEEELWLALRALPPAAAALLRLREPSDLPSEDGAPPRMETALAQLSATPLHAALREAERAHARRSGPAPVSLGAYAALLLAAETAFNFDLASVLPRSAPLVRQSREAMKPPLSDEVNWVEAQLKLMLQTRFKGCCGCQA